MGSYFGTLFTNSGQTQSAAPDASHFERVDPPDDFVLCRDAAGTPTAVYSWSIWDLNPYRLSARSLRKINFDTVAPDGSRRKEMVVEIKNILFLVIYSAESGRLGRLSASSVVKYFQELRAMAAFCDGQSAKPLVGAISIRQLLTNRTYLAALLQEQGHRRQLNAKLSALLRYLSAVGEHRLGYKVVQRDELAIKRLQTEQHVVIPTRIYIAIINSLGNILDELKVVGHQLGPFIACFTDEYYGRSNLKQKQMGVGGRQFHRPLFQQSLHIHGLTGVMIGDFFCSSRKNLPVAIASIQYALKTIIHLYTGMRDQEVQRLEYNCVSVETAPAVKNLDGIEVEPEKIINILSTTTKYEGYRRHESWLATEEVLAAISVARSICRGLAKHYAVPAENCPLFVSPAILSSANFEVRVKDHHAHTNWGWRDDLLIDENDLIELSATDPGRDFSRDLRFEVGSSWPLSSHQFRRSLAFYASNSGFVSLPTIRMQFKHLTLQMARYYRNGFGNLRTIFGYYNDKEKRFELPSSHIALEFQMGIPVSVANQLIEDMLSGGSSLFGGTGSYMEKQKNHLVLGEVSVSNLRADTIHRVHRGEISYRSTLLGGCTKVGNCDLFMLGDFTACLSCEEAIIRSEKVDEMLLATSRELNNYDARSGEYQIAKAEIERLVRFNSHFLKG
jgi:integrase